MAVPNGNSAGMSCENGTRSSLFQRDPSRCASCLRNLSPHGYKQRGFYFDNVSVGRISVTGDFTAIICNRCWNGAWQIAAMDGADAEAQATSTRFGEVGLFTLAQTSRDVSDFFHSLILRNLQEGRLSVDVDPREPWRVPPLLRDANIGSRCACCLKPNLSFPIDGEGSWRSLTLENEPVGDAKVSGEFGVWICKTDWDMLMSVMAFACEEINRPERTGSPMNMAITRLRERIMFLANQGTLKIDVMAGQIG